MAPAWSEHAAYADARGAEVGEKMLALTRPAPGDRVLELACGPGGLGLAAASLVAPEGEVVLSDVAAEMTSIAATRAKARGLANVRVRQLDLESIDEADGSYDVVLCREGLMFATNPARATREIRRVLRPDGRVAIAVWGPRARNPWLGVVLDAVSAQIGRPVPPPGIPGPFSLADAERLEQLLVDASLADVVVSEQSVPMRAASFEEWWTRTAALAGPLTKILAALPEQAKQALRTRLHDTTRAYQAAAGMEFPGVSLIISARRT
ncbi:MAG: class I SAM-dependent methyltransferase [Actinomycetota bacterium]|nr:class I SAM-dependent methyltransferase [Actinomycetota bacterium]